jgi:putative transposase
LARASYYYQPTSISAENVRLMHLLDEQYTATPFYGVRKMTAWLNEVQQANVNVKRVRRLLRWMGLAAIYAKPRLSQSAPGQQVYPYLLRNVPITRVNQVWSTEIVCTQMTKTDGFTRRAGRNRIADFHLVSCDHDSINE